jgi:alpha-galactosidase
VRCGAEGVRLGERRLEAATIAGVEGLPGEPVVRMTHRLCRALCPNPRLSAQPFYGWNNWYYTGPTGSSAKEVEEDTELLASLAPPGVNRPYMVVDLGWEAAMHGAGPWEHGNAKFPDMPGLAARIRSRNVIPGIWIRPLLMNERLTPSLVLPPKRAPQEGDPPYVVMDPSVPDVLERVRQAIRHLTGWGYRMIKFDFSTWDILGRWGFQMGADITQDGWSFADTTRTTAEVILGFYRAIREAAGDVPLIGCNVIGHLAAGLVELQRIGDDNGDQDWNRARKMGINALGFRTGQHNTFFAADADCAVFTKQIPSRMALQLLDLIARSGTPLFVSADPKLVDAGWKKAIREALDIASRTQATIEPLDWMETAAPARWRSASGVLTYDWYGADGVNPLVR